MARKKQRLSRLKPERRLSSHVLEPENLNAKYDTEIPIIEPLSQEKVLIGKTSYRSRVKHVIWNLKVFFPFIFL